MKPGPVHSTTVPYPQPCSFLVASVRALQLERDRAPVTITLELGSWIHSVSHQILGKAQLLRNLVPRIVK